MAKLADLIWKNAELLRGAYKENEYRKVILPFTILRRLDCTLESTKQAALDQWETIRDQGYTPEMNDTFLTRASGTGFYNLSRFTLAGLQADPDGLRDNLEHYVNGFSHNVREIFEKFTFLQVIDKLQEKERLFLVLQRFAETDLHPDVVSNIDMGQAFEELLRRFNDLSPAGEQYTPRDAIQLMVNILLDPDDEILSRPGVVRSIYDPAAGTGGMLSVAEEHITTMNPRAKLSLFGQELEDETYAICKADMLIRGQDPANIALGDSLKSDLHAGKRFDYLLSNPPYGVEWKPAKDTVEKEYKKGYGGRFGPGLPRISDGQMLFTLHLLSKMQPLTKTADGTITGGSRIGVVHNGSPLFTGDAGSGESEIRRWILENDYLEAIVALPPDMFYNTGINTYLWFLTNRKEPHRKGKIQLINAVDLFIRLQKSLGKKRNELSQDQIEEVTQIYDDFQAGSRSRIFDNTDFFFRKVTVERPLRLRFDVSAEKVGALRDDPAFGRLKPEMSAALISALETLVGHKPWMDAVSFNVDLRMAFTKGSERVQECSAQAASSAPAKSIQPTDAIIKLVHKHIGERDEDATIVRDVDGKPLPDAELRDTEKVPYGEDVKAYFAREVKPHWPEAWINETVRDEKDDQVGLVGTEINFNRYFYIYQPPRPLEEIDAELKQVEAEIAALLAEVTE
ncbi:class I SAM-dependent DNA methyltransferase [Acidithiobacillus sp.]|jgi:type I restriction enzyme M protein|uniref:type I restriction-modification system subunit M n=1 Tax=Acidithiobacillus sp. TaxID=1872118 RepID=UPI0025B9A61A|nr:class I SAM-dependent DNA methyltransferase [Acidithiobacillus sp.]MCK9189489.1 type I restriction-modification system subunit M [Acidithiobacillus sp.]MCK9359234.1 type I restriction-modification system subunit M [Acidithiobacillus sp.]